MSDTAKHKVLVIDDDPIQLELMDRSLRYENFEVHTCRAALGFTNALKTFVPNIVLLDVNIPALSGDKLLQLTRRMAPPSTKFLLFSACDESKLRALSRESGADGWISKSTSCFIVAQRLRKLMNEEPPVPAAPEAATGTGRK